MPKTLTRLQFLLISLAMGFLFGASFSALKSSNPQAVNYLGKFGIPMTVTSVLYTGLTGLVLMVLGGLTSLYVGLFFTGTFFLLFLSETSPSYLFRVVIQIALAALAVKLVKVRIETISPETNSLKRKVAFTFALSLIPILGSIQYWHLVLANQKRDEQ